MKLSEVLIKPILTEKANAQQEKLRRYAFRVDRRANKLEIKKAVEEFYGPRGARADPSGARLVRRRGRRLPDPQPRSLGDASAVPRRVESAGQDPRDRFVRSVGADATAAACP